MLHVYFFLANTEMGPLIFSLPAVQFNKKCLMLCLLQWAEYFIIFNPMRMRSRVTVVSLSVCMSVCVSVNALTARVLISATQTWYYQNRHDT